MFHSNPYFHFSLIDIPSKHSCSPLENNKFWKITQKAIHTQNQQFVLLNNPFNLMKTSWCALQLGNWLQRNNNLHTPQTFVNKFFDNNTKNDDHEVMNWWSYLLVAWKQSIQCS
jgi:hypothetical protein